MSERLRDTGFESEKIQQLEQAGAERARQIERGLEKAANESQVENLEAAREAALEIATEKQEQEVQVETTEQQPKMRTRPTKKQLDDNFNRSMSTVRKNMSPASRTFSKFIHNKAVETASDAVASTVARPNLIIAGGLGTIILCSAVYLISKNYGYVLSGFEAIGTFILGWCIGAIFEFARVGFINQKIR